MYELSIRTRFSAAHHLRDYNGPCAAQHGHNWDVEVFVRGPALDGSGMLVDFKEMKTSVNDVLGELDHRNLNDVAAFGDRNPTSENIARFIFDRLSVSLGGRAFAVSRVCVRETPDSMASYEASLPPA
jgi:6-pyruvoyltetrahydropterin/6-carboxytetrahydropterin synthase